MMKIIALAGVTFNLVTAQIVLGNNQIFAGKDLSAFNRALVTDDLVFEATPITLAIVDEKLFFVNNGEVTDATITEINWNFINNGDSVAQPPAPVVDGKFLLAVGLDENFITFGSKGAATFNVEILNTETVTSDSFEDARVWHITGFASVLPLILIVVLALMSRNVYIAMFFGIWTGALIITEGDIALSLKDMFDVHMIPSITNGDNFRTITFTLFLGGFLAMIKRAGGQDGFSDVVSKFATSPKKTQLAAVGAGFGLFFDDYSSVLILGASFKGLTDKFHVSREKLAFVADATSAPIASIAPISSWIAFEIGLISLEIQGIKDGSEFDSRNDLQGNYPFFLSTIPSRYYPFLMLTVQVTLIAAGVEFGPMLYAERKARLQKRTDGGDGRMEIPLEMDSTTPDDDTPRRAWNFFIPLLFFLFTLLMSLINIGKENLEEGVEDNLREIFGATDSFEALVYTTMGASLFSLVFYLVQFKKDGKIVIPGWKSIKKAIDCRVQSSDELALQEGIQLPGAVDDSGEARPLMYFTESVNIWVEGFKNLVPAILILCMAFTIKSIVQGLATDRLFTDIILSSDIDAGALPTIIFIVSGFLAVATGTSFGTMSIMFPLVSFATFEASDGDIRTFTVALSSIMAGAVWGDHSSPISDTTILSSIGAGCQIGAHVYTQLPYALWAGLFSIVFGTLPAGYGWDPVVMLLVSMTAIVIATLLVSAPIVAESGRLDFFSELALKMTKSENLEYFKTETKKFAEENPDMVDEEPFQTFQHCCPRLAALCGGCVKKSPFIKREDTYAELEAIADGSKFNKTQEGEVKEVTV